MRLSWEQDGNSHRAKAGSLEFRIHKHKLGDFDLYINDQLWKPYPSFERAAQAAVDKVQSEIEAMQKALYA